MTCPKKKQVKKRKSINLVYLGLVGYLCIFMMIMVNNSNHTPDNINSSFIKQLALSTKEDKIRWEILHNNKRAGIKRWIAYKVEKGFILESSTS